MAYSGPIHMTLTSLSSRPRMHMQNFLGSLGFLRPAQLSSKPCDFSDSRPPLLAVISRVRLPTLSPNVFLLTTDGRERG